MLRLRRVMLQVVQFVGHNKILKSLGNRVLRINDTDGEVHVFAMAVKEPIEHAVIPFALPERCGRRMKSEESTSLRDETQ